MIMNKCKEIEILTYVYIVIHICTLFLRREKIMKDIAVMCRSEYEKRQWGMFISMGSLWLRSMLKIRLDRIALQQKFQFAFTYLKGPAKRFWHGKDLKLYNVIFKHSYSNCSQGLPTNTIFYFHYNRSILKILYFTEAYSCSILSLLAESNLPR